MPKISYQAKISNNKYEDNIEFSFDNLRFGSRPKTSKPSRKIIDYKNYPSMLTDGWLESPEVLDENNIISISDSKFIKNGSKILPSLNGLSTAAYKEIRIDSQEYVDIFGTEPTLGAPSISSFLNPKAYMFKRHNGKVSIHEEFTHKITGTDDTSVARNEFISKEFSNTRYILFGIKKPIPLTEYKDSNIDLGINDYLSLSLNLSTALTNLGITEEEFLDLSDYISLDSLRIRSWDIKNIKVTLKAKYFPIYPHVTVIADMENGLQQIGLDFLNDVSPNRGIVSLNGSAVSKTMGECKGFYLFYGCVPSVYHNSEQFSIPVHELLSELDGITPIEINNREQEGQVAITEPMIAIARDIKYSSANTGLIIPEHYKNVFIEPSSPLIINGDMYDQNTRMYFNNNGKINLEISAPDHLFDLVEKASLLSNNTIQVQSRIVGEAAALYGLFTNVDASRLSLMSVHKLSDSTIDPETIKVAEAVGYGLGKYSAGGFSLGEITTYQSTVTYTNENPYDYSNEYTRNISVRIVPEKDGYDFILPAWTIKTNIKVYEMSEKHYETFSGWKFIEPDIIMLDKDKIHPTRTYEIVYEAIASPYIPNVNLLDNTINIISDKDPASAYPSFKGLYLLSSKEIKIRIGYINSLGAKDYFSNEATVHLIITNDYLDQTITRLKSISF
jgi:hypothetical protein